MGDVYEESLVRPGREAGSALVASPNCATPLRQCEQLRTTCALAVLLSGWIVPRRLTVLARRSRLRGEEQHGHTAARGGSD
jgi:hypothetical protein